MNKASFPAKRKFKLPTVWQVLMSKLEINFFLSHKEKGPVFQKCLLQKLDLQAFPSFHWDRTFVNIFVEFRKYQWRIFNLPCGYILFYN